MDLLVLCTGNICRSPMAEALLDDRLRRRGVDARVHSAGLLQAGRPASEHGVAVLRTLGLDLGDHRSRTMDEGMLRGADLVLGMAREHVREAAVLVPEAWPRTFTIKEAVRRGDEIGARALGQSIDEWIAKLHAGRSHSELLGEDPADDVADPYGAARVHYERTARELVDLVDRFVDLAFPEGSQP